ncbi:unnamed protein product, partial [Ectocarpus sp. 6 AP-2014]
CGGTCNLRNRRRLLSHPFIPSSLHPSPHSPHTPTASELSAREREQIIFEGASSERMKQCFVVLIRPTRDATAV